MAKRYKVYKRALKLNNGNAESTAPLGKYKEWATGERKISYTREASSNPGQMVIIYLKPFNTGEALVYETEMSERAKNKMNDLIDAVAKFGHTTKPEAGANLGNWIPAKATVNISGTGTESRTSKITGESYKKETGEASFTIPIGKTANTDRFLDVAKNIRAGVEAKNGEYTVDFTEEKWRGI